FDVLDNFFRFFSRDSLLQRHLLTSSSTKRRFDLSVGKSFQRNAALNELCLQNIVEALQLELIIRGYDKISAFDRYVTLASFKVEALLNLFHCLINGVVDFRHIYIGNDVE